MVLGVTSSCADVCKGEQGGNAGMTWLSCFLGEERDILQFISWTVGKRDSFRLDRSYVQLGPSCWNVSRSFLVYIKKPGHIFNSARFMFLAFLLLCSQPGFINTSIIVQYRQAQVRLGVIGRVKRKTKRSLFTCHLVER